MKLSENPQRVEYTTFTILKKLLELTPTEISKADGMQYYDAAWVQYAFKKMEIKSDLSKYQFNPQAYGDVANYMNAVASILQLLIENRKDDGFMNKIKSEYLTKENEDMTGEVLAASLIYSPNDAEILQRAISTLASQDLTKVLNLLALIRLENVAINSEILVKAETFVQSQLDYIRDFGNLNLMALAITALSNKITNTFFSEFERKVEDDMINPFFRTSLGFAEITSVSRMMKYSAVPKEKIDRLELDSGYLLRLEGNKMVLAEGEPENEEDLILADLKFMNVRPSFVSRMMLAFYKTGRSHGFIVTEQQKRDYYDKAQQIDKGTSVVLKKKALYGAGIMNLIVVAIIAANHFLNFVTFVENLEWYILVPLFYTGLSLLIFAAKGKEFGIVIIKSIAKAFVHITGST